MRFSSSDLFRLFFSELERLEIPYVILHSYDRFPEHLSSDVDFAVLTSDLSKLAGIQSELAARHGWRLAHAVEAHIYAIYTVLIEREDPRSFLQLDACGHYVENNCFLLQDDALLKDRRRFHDFYVPHPALEFAYLLAKALAKFQPMAPKMARLRELWELAPEQSEQQFWALCGPAQGALEQWFKRGPSEWETLRQAMLERNRFGFADRAREAFRAFKRIRRPSGLHLALLGPDGCGKSTLLERAGSLLETPLFRRQLVFHFRPKTFERNKSDSPVTDPHSKPPRSRAAGLAKLVYYFVDNFAGYIAKVFPAKVRNELIIFCRDFDDVLVDPRRYRLHRAGWVAKLLRGLLPQPDLTFVLDAEPEEIRARKTELSLEELRRQRDAFKQLASDNRHYLVVSSAQPPDELAREVCRHAIEFLAQREKGARLKL